MALDIVRDYCHTLVKSSNIHYPDQSQDRQPTSYLDSLFILTFSYGIGFSRDAVKRAGDTVLLSVMSCPQCQPAWTGLASSP